VDDGLKQRLVGAFVLLALGVLFIPTLLEPEYRRDIDRTSHIPPAPAIEPIKVEAPTRVSGLGPAQPAGERYKLLEEDALPQLIEQTEEAVNKAQPHQQNIKQAESKILLTKEGVPKAWAIQVSSYKTESRANEFVSQLKKDGYVPFTRTLKTTKGMVTRIYIGPRINPTMAQNLKRELDKKYRIETLVVRFDP
jgi:DedD protein